MRVKIPNDRIPTFRPFGRRPYKQKNQTRKMKVVHTWEIKIRYKINILAAQGAAKLPEVQKNGVLDVRN